MIDLKWVRAYPNLAKQSQIDRQEDPAIIDQVLDLDTQYHQAQTKFEETRAEQKALGQQIASASADQKSQLLQKTKALAETVGQLKLQSENLQAQRDALAYEIPNIIEAAPAGGETDFQVVSTYGEPRSFDFEPKDHLDLAEITDTIDVRRGAKVGGSRFYFMKGLGARLEFALLNMAIDQATQNGFTLLNTPTLVLPEIMAGTGFLGKHAAEVYKLADPDDSYLIGTSEVAIAGYHKDEILDLSNGPLCYAGFSTCYRREAGSHGKDTRGIIRVHQFNKVEMFAFCKPDDSFEVHKKMLAMEEAMIQKCELPYRVIDIAAGDLGSSAARKFDCEAWLPTQNRYLELTSTSNCTTFQARRLSIRYKDVETNTNPVCATLNGTLATTRWIVSIFENHQNADGSINVPAALQPYIGVKELGARPSINS
ncbi:MAG: serine--tRNA ligase [Bifidobacteriaceae bacterium]|jgi:seryl-tRNA synthetase|nr:serine--tRNA ligase [Bifidobacteriaceae bacterium]